MNAEHAEIAEEIVGEAIVNINEISGEIVDAAIKVHRALGPGLLESAYEACLAYELNQRRIKVRRQIELPIRYEGVQLEVGYRIDLLVADLVVVELKAVEAIKSVHKVQLLSYLRLSNKRLGLRINFHQELLKDGVTRIANNV